ncbi:hypothetical protein OS493_027111 [Desmophyllum pertusum]|uniref:Uncharacterized protein n=1 Tax=Desmophyllum pertusum TaxID=174260 RepID=A0A9W9ZYA3_9CNID|nr:hypothetical protein OS493_027111 [Desmophyllum pertusum]
MPFAAPRKGNISVVKFYSMAGERKARILPLTGIKLKDKGLFSAIHPERKTQHSTCCCYGKDTPTSRLEMLLKESKLVQESYGKTQKQGYLPYTVTCKHTGSGKLQVQVPKTLSGGWKGERKEKEHGGWLLKGKTSPQHQTPVELANGNKEIIDLLNNPDKAAEILPKKAKPPAAAEIGRGGSVETDTNSLVPVQIRADNVIINQQYTTTVKNGNVAIGPGSQVVNAQDATAK